MIKKEIGGRIRSIRNSQTISQEKLALKAGIDRTYLASVETGMRNISVVNLEKILKALGVSFCDFFSNNITSGVNVDYTYIVNDEAHVAINGKTVVTNKQILDAINFCNHALQMLDEQTKQFDINIFEALALRNLSGMVGEYFGKSVIRYSNGALHSNLHQDGYPDLLLTNTPNLMKYYESLYTIKNGKKYPKDKTLFSPYKYGGIEIKATCGSTPSASKMPKPLIGENRIAKVNSFDWKAHHRETNNLLAIFWDFINEVPTVAACFYRNDLTVDDWGKIVEPKAGGGRTTSVSIMKHNGVKKMCDGWIAVIDMPEYIAAFSKKKWIGNAIK